jgi:hypothetical protein
VQAKETFCPENPKGFGTWLKLGDKSKTILDVLRLRIVSLKCIETQR